MPMKTFEQERIEYIKRFGVEPPKCEHCEGRGTWEGWDYNNEIETWNVCEFCEGNGYYTVKQTADTDDPALDPENDYCSCGNLTDNYPVICNQCKYMSSID